MSIFYNWMQPTKNENFIPQKLIKIKDNKLVLDIFDIPTNSEINVFSIIGTARTGKSTLLNCIGSYILKRNVKIFNIDDTDEHCTIGIDMYYFQKEKIVLLDCQGLKLSDSSNDPKLLLIIYLISDFIIYNQRSILNNDIFETLQPLATFINYIENINYKPQLIFRILDSELKYDPNKLLERTMSKKDDQYQNTREAILILFSKIDVYFTNSLDRIEKKLLNENKFYDFMLNDDNNFSFIIKKILENQIHKKNFTDWYNSINEYIININSNKKIDFNKLDIYSICIEKEILEFKLSINTDNYKNFSCSILNDDYLQIVIPKIDYMENLLKIYNSKFSMASKKIYEFYYNEIKNNLETPINNIKNTITEQTNQRIKDEITIYFNDQHIVIELKLINSIITIDAYEKDYEVLINKINTFQACIKKYYEPVVNNYNLLFEDMKLKIIELFNKIVDFQNNNFLEMENYFSKWEEKYNGVYDYLLKSHLLKKVKFKTQNYNFNFRSNFSKYLKNKIMTDYFIENTNFNYYNVNYTDEETINILYNNLIKDIDCLKLNTIYIYSISVNKYSIKKSNFIIDKYNKIKNKLFSDEHLDRIINIKLSQSKYFHKKNSYKINDNKYFFDKLIKYHLIKEHEFINCQIDIKTLRKKLCLEEFRKYLVSKYKVKIIINKKEIMNNLIKLEPMILKLYEKFMLYRNLMNNNIIALIK